MSSLKSEALILVMRAYVHALIAGPATREVKSPKVMVVVNLTTNIGDMICTTPVFRAIKNKYSTCKVVVVGVAKNKEMLAGLTDVDEYIVFDTADKVIARLNALKPDGGVAINPSPQELGILILAGAGRVTVFTHSAFMSRAYAALARLTVTVPYEPGQYVPAQFLNLLKPFGIDTTDTARHLAVDAAVLARVRAAHPGPFAVIAPKAGHAYKEWPRERFDAVATHLKSTGVNSVFVGSETLEELKALVSLAVLAISNDSGVAQIAQAFNTPALVIAGSTDWREHHIDRPNHRVVHSEGTIAMRSYVSNHEAADEAKAIEQMRAISVEQVTASIDGMHVYP